MKCSDRIKSTVVLNGEGWSCERDENGENGSENVPEEADWDLDRASGLSLPLGECDLEGNLEKGTLLRGVAYPGVCEVESFRSASADALIRRFVVPNALVEPERAEHTSTTLWRSM